MPLLCCLPPPPQWLVPEQGPELSMALWQLAVPLLLFMLSVAEMKHSEFRSVRGFQTEHALLQLQ